jgi:hypothetical protein
MKTNPPPAAGGVDLLPWVDPLKDGLSGTWRFRKGALVAESADLARLQLPYRAPEEYDLLVIFSRQRGSGAVQQFFPWVGKPAVWRLGPYDGLLGQRPPARSKDAPPVKKLSSPLRPNQQYTLRLEIRKSGVKVELDGEAVFEFSGGEEAGPASQHLLPEPAALGLGAETGTVTFHRLAVREAGGAGRLLRERNFARPGAADEEWRQGMAALPGEEAFKYVLLKLMELNPTWDGQGAAPAVRDGRVIGAEFLDRRLSDLSPAGALQDLQILSVGGASADSQLSDLTFLRGLPLQRLRVERAQVTDLSPLKGLPLTELYLSRIPAGDFSPLQGLRLAKLHLPATKPNSLSMLKGMPLQELNLLGTPVPESEYPILKTLPLKSLWISPQSRLAEALKALPGLEQINDAPAAEFFRRYSRP